MMARADLAALLVKIAGLAPMAPWTAATVSPFVEADGLDRRVRRLLDEDAPRALSIWPALARASCVGAAALVVPASSATASSNSLTRSWKQSSISDDKTKVRTVRTVRRVRTVRTLRTLRTVRTVRTLFYYDGW